MMIYILSGRSPVDEGSGGSRISGLNPISRPKFHIKKRNGGNNIKDVKNTCMLSKMLTKNAIIVDLSLRIATDFSCTCACNILC